MKAAKALATREDDRLRKEFEKWAILTYTNNQGVVNTKKGADKGIDGIVYFLTASDESERMAIQVKSGHIDRGTIAKLRGDMEREKAELGLLITLEEPTKPMIEEAKKSGLFWHELMQKHYDRIQIVTIQDIIENDKRLDLPMSHKLAKKSKEKPKEAQMKLSM